MSTFVNLPCDLETTTAEYKRRNNKTVLNEKDKKFIQAMMNLRNNHNIEMKKRKCTEYLKSSPLSSIFVNKSKETKLNKTLTQENTTVKKEEAQKCSAILMNGKQCSCK